MGHGMGNGGDHDSVWDCLSKIQKFVNNSFFDLCIRQRLLEKNASRVLHANATQLLSHHPWLDCAHMFHE